MPRILIIDDDKDLLEVVQALLIKKGFQVEANTNWDDAEEKLDSFQPQIILLDVFLSGVDGLQICKKLKADPNTSPIPVIVFSGYPSIGETAIYEYGADDFITKPFEVYDLIDKIHAVLSKRSTMA
jgi:DNA-binding response OmpR family regulator